MHRQRERVVSVPQPFQRGRKIMAVETSSDKDNGNGSNRYRHGGANFSYFFCVLCSTYLYVEFSMLGPIVLRETQSD